MQSYLQFKQAGIVASAQVKRGHEKSRRDAPPVVDADADSPKPNSQQPFEAVSFNP